LTGSCTPKARRTGFVAVAVHVYDHDHDHDDPGVLAGRCSLSARGGSRTATPTSSARWVRDRTLAVLKAAERGYQENWRSPT
jgi:hypothetical protein